MESKLSLMMLWNNETIEIGRCHMAEILGHVQLNIVDMYRTSEMANKWSRVPPDLSKCIIFLWNHKKLPKLSPHNRIDPFFTPLNLNDYQVGNPHALRRRQLNGLNALLKHIQAQVSHVLHHDHSQTESLPKLNTRNSFRAIRWKRQPWLLSLATIHQTQHRAYPQDLSTQLSPTQQWPQRRWHFSSNRSRHWWHGKQIQKN